MPRAHLPVHPTTSTTDTRRRRQLGYFFAGTFGLTWGLAALAGLAPGVIRTLTGSEFSTSNPVYYLAVSSPSVVGVAMIASSTGAAGLRELASRVFRWRVHPAYYAVVLLGWPAMDVLARVVQQTVGGSRTTSSGDDLWSLLLDGTPPTPVGLWYLAPVFLLATLALDAGPVGEEIGWKGYALPRLLAGRRGPLAGALVLGLVWGLWHAPAFLISGTAQKDQGMGFAWLLLGTVASSVIMTWLYRRTGGSILVSGILVHLMTNSTVARLWAIDLVFLVPAVLAAVALHRGRAGRTPRGPARHR